MADPSLAGISEAPERKCRLLVVDDQAVIRKLIKQVCTDKRLDFELYEAGDGEEAWTVFKKKHPDVVITDVCMPQADGIELLRRIRRANRDTEVIIITGFAETRMVVDALKSGASNFIEKPFNIATIADELGRSLSRWKASREADRLEGELLRERSLRESSARLATAGRIMAGLASEMRNPLTWIKGNAELVSELLNTRADKFGDKTALAEIETLLSDIREGALAIENQLGLIRRFQGLSGIAEDRVVVLERLVRDSVLLAGGKRPANAEVVVTPPPPHVKVRLNPVEMESCLVNLVITAFESIKPGGGVVTVKAETIGIGEESGWAELTISGRRTSGTVVRIARERKSDEDQSFWLWAAHKAAKENGVAIETQTDADGAFTAQLRFPWFVKEPQ